MFNNAIQHLRASWLHAAAFLAAVAQGDAQLDGGEGVAYDSALMESMTHIALSEMHSDKAIDPDVIA